MNLERDAFVRHSGQPAWGVGRVLALIGTEKARIRFTHVGEKLLSVQAAPLEPATPTDSERKFLEGKGPRPAPGEATKQHSDLVAAFLRAFPEGFSSPEYWKKERGYKVDAHELARVELSKERLCAQVKARQFNDIATAAQRVMNATNLAFPNEKMDFADALKVPENREAFGVRLLDLLYGDAPYQERFERFTDFLFAVHAAKWTVATYFPFFCFPAEHMFLKPDVTQRAAEAYGFWLAYDSHLNWRTYEQLLAFAAMLRERIAFLEPADMLDIQSFLWVAGYYEQH